MKNQAPFLDIGSFVAEESPEVTESETSVPAISPFVSVYESEEGADFVSPETREYVTFLNEFYDEEFDEALSTLVDEASAIYGAHFGQEQEDPQDVGSRAERLLNQHFAPLVAQAETSAAVNVLVAAARYLAAHSPSLRAQGQTYQIAYRLSRGERLFEG